MSAPWSYVVAAYGFAYGVLIVYGLGLRRRHRRLPPAERNPWPP